MPSRKSILILVLSMLLVVSFIAPSLADELEQYRFLKIAAEEQRAVVKTPEGELRLIAPGDRIGEQIRVLEIAEERIVLQNPTADGPETVIVRIENGRQKIDRMKRGPVERRPLSGRGETLK